MRQNHASRQMLFQSTQPKRAATLPEERVTAAIMISIHAARVGCDRNSGGSR